MTIGFIGTGLLGYPMAEQLLRQGVSLTIFNRSPSKAAPLRNLGAILADSPEGAFRESEGVITMVSDATAVREVVFPGKRTAHLSGKTLIQMSTIGPDESREISAEVIRAGGHYLEAPVLGSIPQAQDRKLIVMAGGTRERFEQWMPLLERFGPEPLYIGPVGKAAALKLALNQLIASLTAAFSSSLGLVRREGLDVEVFMGILRKSALYAPTFDKKLGMMLERHYTPANFPTKHLLKDVDLFIREGRSLGLGTDAVEGVREALRRAIESGFSDVDYSAMYEGVDRSEAV